ncbi:L-cysteine desulfidase family protein [Pseudobutyrivibrio sp. MD2005]|uniref:L-cysteine desulfidase family protein n=1 Tax=Pseudobutyrivibrio sp. MD2005 TaxID=1410616 RepID=UPI00048A37DC|nr:L-serine ammonia-lyase, iron-sulfur-dependent, subunit alpha [Pseudobutyrivibrio sp. MD2005]
MDKKIYDTFITLLTQELRLAMGCTEPIAVAYAAAKARETLGVMPERIELYCSGNIIKNVKAVTVPNSGGRRGLEVAAILGAAFGNPSLELEVVSQVTDEEIDKLEGLLAQDLCHCHLQTGKDNLYIRAEVFAGEDSALVEISEKHTYITRIEKNGEVILTNPSLNLLKSDNENLNLKSIYEFANCFDMNDVHELIERQIECNIKIAEEGINNPYGSEIGRRYIQMYGKEDYRFRAVAYAAAGSDARMNGCALPVVINSGSGNQSIAISVPIIVYAKEKGISKEKLIRGLVFADLMALLQKKYIGDLSAYCGATCAGCAAVTGIAYIENQPLEVLGNIVVNSISTIGGMVCDGAKSSCAAKIAASISMGFLAYDLAVNNLNFKDGEGLVVADIEETIARVGRMGREGMRSTDEEILNMMLGY